MTFTVFSYFKSKVNILIDNYIYLMGQAIGKMFFKSGANTISKEIPKDFFDLQAKDIDGKIVNFNQYRDKKAIMVVNVACK